LQGLAQAARMRGELGATLAFARQSVELAVDAGSPEWIGTNQWAVAEALEAAGDLAGARATLEASVRALESAAIAGLAGRSANPAGPDARDAGRAWGGPATG